MADRMIVVTKTAIMAIGDATRYSQTVPDRASNQPTRGPPKDNLMKQTKRIFGHLGILLCGGLLAGTAHGQPSVSVGVRVAPLAVVLPSVEIHAVSDFYEPLTSHGRWEVIGGHGRVWIPGGVETDWRPYSDGYWQYTDAGWYWASNEPWAWATYHYGRWDVSPQFGWFWVPQTQWSPAWVSWHSGGGYIGWAPLYPAATFARSGSMEIDMRVISPRAFVFVQERQFLQPVRRATVVVHNTTIINQTVNITNTKIVNNTVINGGPTTPVIERISGQKLQAVPARELRHKEETAVAARQRAPAAPGGKKVSAPVPSDPGAGGKNPPVAPATPPVLKPAPPTRTTATPVAPVTPAPPLIHKPVVPPHHPPPPLPRKPEAPGERPKPTPIAPPLKPELKPDNTRPPAVKVPTQPKIEKPEKPGLPTDRKGPPGTPEPPPEKEKGRPKPGDKDHEKKPKE